MSWKHLDPVIQVQLFQKLTKFVPEMFEFENYFEVRHISNCYGTCVKDELTLDKTEQYLPNLVGTGPQGAKLHMNKAKCSSKCGLGELN